MSEGLRIRAAAIVRLAIPQVAANSEPPTELKIWSFGTVATTKGNFLFDQKAAASVMAEFRDYGNRLTFDYGHDATNPDKNGEAGKSAGSCMLELRTDGLYAVDIRWTPQAAQQISDKEWLYFSPTYLAEKKTNRILALVNIALTNVPATKNLAPLIAASRETAMADEVENTTASEDDEAMAKAKADARKAARARMARAKAEMSAAEAECSAFEEAAKPAPPPPPPESDAKKPPPPPPEAASTAPPGGEDEGDDDDDEPVAKEPPAKDAAATAAGKGPGATAPVANAIEKCARELTGKSDPSAIVGALKAMKAEADKAKQLASANTSLTTELQSMKVTRMVNKAVRLGKLEPKKKAWALSLGMKDYAELEGYIEQSTAIVATPENGGAHDPDPQVHAVALSQVEADIATRLNLDPKKYAAQKQKNAAARSKRQTATAED